MRLTLTNPLDMHIHLRDSLILESVLPFTAQSFIGAVAMPNLTPPITNVDMAKEYERRIHALDSKFHPFIPLYITDNLNAQDLKRAKESGIFLLKLYPKGVTTNSSAGLSEILTQKFLKQLEVAEELEMILCIHCETNGFSLERELEFMPIVKEIATRFKRLKIIIEHMSDARSIFMIKDYENVFCTLTLHHITLDLDSLLGDGLDPHSFCKPILKTPKDREALLELALSAHPKVSFGSDSAPHLESSKLKGAPGIFSAPNLLPALATLFHKHGALSNLQAFISDNAMRIYNLDFEESRSVVLERCEKYSNLESISVGGELIKVMPSDLEFKVASPL